MATVDPLLQPESIDSKEISLNQLRWIRDSIFAASFSQEDQRGLSENRILRSLLARLNEENLQKLSAYQLLQLKNKIFQNLDQRFQFLVEDGKLKILSRHERGDKELILPIKDFLEEQEINEKTPEAIPKEVEFTEKAKKRLSPVEYDYTVGAIGLFLIGTMITFLLILNPVAFVPFFAIIMSEAAAATAATAITIGIATIGLVEGAVLLFNKQVETFSNFITSVFVTRDLNNELDSIPEVPEQASVAPSSEIQDRAHKVKEDLSSVSAENASFANVTTSNKAILHNFNQKSLPKALSGYADKMVDLRQQYFKDPPITLIPVRGLLGITNGKACWENILEGIKDNRRVILLEDKDFYAAIKDHIKKANLGNYTVNISTDNPFLAAHHSEILTKLGLKVKCPNVHPKVIHEIFKTDRLKAKSSDSPIPLVQKNP